MFGQRYTLINLQRWCSYEMADFIAFQSAPTGPIFVSVIIGRAFEGFITAESGLSTWEVL